MSDIVVFLGPSLSLDEARSILPRATYLPPARQGDVLAALAARPTVIALIDGVFEQAPSVWHGELRSALDEGVVLLGASSMGALRAVELAPWGMEGVGEVFAAYRDGRLDDDADVALLHAEAEFGFRPLTVPLVNVLSLAEKALAAGLLSRAQALGLVEVARATHYKQRRWPELLATLPEMTRAGLERFRRDQPCDVKADDARACLRQAQDRATQGRRPVRAASVSVWGRRAALSQLGEAPDTSVGSTREGLRTLLLAEWARSAGLVPEASLVATFEGAAVLREVPLALRRRWAEAAALEEQLLQHPERLLAEAPLADEGPWVAAMRSGRKARRRG